MRGWLVLFGRWGVSSTAGGREVPDRARPAGRMTAPCCFARPAARPRQSRRCAALWACSANPHVPSCPALCVLAGTTTSASAPTGSRGLA